MPGAADGAKCLVTFTKKKKPSSRSGEAAGIVPPAASGNGEAAGVLYRP